MRKGYVGVVTAEDVVSRKPISVYLFSFTNEAITWEFKVQKDVSLFIAVAKYIVAIGTRRIMLWMKIYSHDKIKPGQVYFQCDSQSYIHLSINSRSTLN